MTPPVYRCVECSQPAPAGQLLCAACEARAATRSQPFGQPPAVSPPPLAPQAYDLSSGAPPHPPNAVPPINLSAPSPPPAQPPFNLQDNGPAPAPSYQPNTVLPPSMPGWQHHPDPSTDPNVLLQQLKQAEGSKPGSSRRMTFLERMGLRMAIRFGLAAIFGMGLLLARLGHRSGQSASSTDTSVSDTPMAVTRSSGRTGTPSTNNNFTNARNTMNAVPTMTVPMGDPSLGGALAQINVAWEDAKNVMAQAQSKLETSAGQADVSLFVRQLEQDRQTIAQNTPAHPIEIHTGCQRMVSAIAEAEAILSSAGQRERLPVSPPNPMGGQPAVPTTPNVPGNSDNTPTSNGGNSAQAPGQPTPSEPQSQPPAGNNSPPGATGSSSSPPSIPGSTETVPGQPNGSSSPPPVSGGNSGQ